MKIKKEIIVNSPIANVFSALTDSDEIPKYFPLQSVESDWVKGNAVLYKGVINSVPFTDFGVIEELIKPRIYRYRYWSDNHGTARTEQNHLTIEYRLETVSEGTKLTVLHDNIKSKEMYDLMKNQVWGHLLNSLKTHMESST